MIEFEAKNSIKMKDKYLMRSNLCTHTNLKLFDIWELIFRERGGIENQLPEHAKKLRRAPKLRKPKSPKMKCFRGVNSLRQDLTPSPVAKAIETP